MQTKTTSEATLTSPTPRVPVAAHTVAIMSTSALGAAAMHAWDRPLEMGGCIALGVGASYLRVRSGIVENGRRELMDDLRTALVPVIGNHGARVLASRWIGKGIGFPSVLKIRYAPGAKDDAVEWGEGLLATVERRLVVTARIKKQDRRGRRLVLELAAPVDPAKVPAEVTRAQLVIAEMFGTRASFGYKLDDSGALKKVEVGHQLRVKVAMKAARMRIERVYSAMLPGRWRAKWDLEADQVVFELRPTLPEFIPHTAEPITDKNRFLIPVNVDEDGNNVYWNLRGSGPHCMVVGKTGTGKTVAINGVAMEFARRGWPVWINDPKQIEFVGMRDWPNVQIVAMTVVEMIAMIKAGHDRMEERYAHIAAGGDESEFEPLLMVLDEYRNFHRLVTAWWSQLRSQVKGLPAKCPVFDWVAAIAEKGRSAMIHILLGTQRPDAEFMSGGMRDNFDTRVSMGALSPQGAQMMWDSAYLGVAVPRKIRGRGTAINENEEVVEIQVPWTPDPRRAYRDGKPQDLAILKSLRPTESLHPPLDLDLGMDTDIDGNDLNEWACLMESMWRPTTAGQPSALRSDPSDHVTAEPLQLTPQDSPPWEESVPDLDLDEVDYEGYSEEDTVRANAITPGELVMVDDQLLLWAVVTDVEEDPFDDSQLAIYWRTEGDEGCLSLPPGQGVQVRHIETDPEEK